MDGPVFGPDKETGETLPTDLQEDHAWRKYNSRAAGVRASVSPPVAREGRTGIPAPAIVALCRQGGQACGRERSRKGKPSRMPCICPFLSDRSGVDFSDRRRAAPHAASRSGGTVLRGRGIHTRDDREGSDRWKLLPQARTDEDQRIHETAAQLEITRQLAKAALMERLLSLGKPPPGSNGTQAHQGHQRDDPRDHRDAERFGFRRGHHGTRHPEVYLETPDGKAHCQTIAEGRSEFPGFPRVELNHRPGPYKEPALTPELLGNGCLMGDSNPHRPGRGRVSCPLNE